MEVSTMVAIVTLVISLGSIGVSLVTKFNHIEHLKADIQSIKELVRDLAVKVDDLERDVSFLQGKLNGEKHQR